MGGSKLPRRLAILGASVAWILMVMWWFINRFDLFPPPLYQHLQTLTLILCPAVFVQAAMVHPGMALSLIMWAFASLMNAVIYYTIGLVLVGVRAKLSSSRSVSH
jgi:hypothetical protein